VTLLPHRFWFRYRFPVIHVANVPRTGTGLLQLPERCRLPDFSELENANRIGDIRAAWNSNGLGFSVCVSGKSTPPVWVPDDSAASDGLQVWIDTRNTQSIHRASRFCHHFCFLPGGIGPRGGQGVGCQLPIARAREETPIAKMEDVPLHVQLTDDGYRLETWLPRECLHGFEPDSTDGTPAIALLGFYYRICDKELGDQFLSVGRDFPFASDPSLWATLELRR